MRKRITAALTAFCLVLCLGASALALEPLGQPVQGMDVSAWQGEIDFEQVRAWGIRTVYIRAAVGQGRQDKDWRANYRKAKAAGLKVGLYHYVTARSQDQAREQAEFFAGLMEGLDMDCRPAMDFESFGDMSKEQINQAALAYVTRLERLCGGKPAVYSNSWTAAHVFDQRLADYPLWIAEYGPDQPREGGALEGLGWVSVYQSRSGAGNSRKCGFGSVHAGYGLGKRRDDASAGRADCFGSVWGHIVGHFTEIWRSCGADRPAKRHSQPQFDLPRSAAANTVKKPKNRVYCPAWGHIVGHFAGIWRLRGADCPAKRHSQPQFDLPRSAAANTELICRIVDERRDRDRPSPWGACLFSNRRNTDKGKIGFIV